MCECENSQFRVRNNELQIWDDDYEPNDFWMCCPEYYTYCPICGENLKNDTTLCQEKSDTGLCHMDFGSDCGVRFPKSNGSILNIEKGKCYDVNFVET